MKKVPYVSDVGMIPCVWDITSFLAPFMRVTHDFGNVHHVWLHKSVEGIITSVSMDIKCKPWWGFSLALPSPFYA